VRQGTEQNLRELGTLRVSACFEASVLASVIAVQEKKIKRSAGRRKKPSRFLMGACGRHLAEPEPLGFTPLPAHGRPVVQIHHLLGGRVL